MSSLTDLAWEEIDFCQVLSASFLNGASFYLARIVDMDIFSKDIEYPQMVNSDSEPKQSNPTFWNLKLTSFFAWI